MFEKLKKQPRSLMIGVIAICMAAILAGGAHYIKTLQDNLEEQAIMNVMTVTKQQQQAFDNFIALDQERMHSFADFFSHTSDISPEDIQRQLTMFNEVEAIYSVMCLDEGWFCSNSSKEIRTVDEENLKYYRSLNGSGVRNAFIGLFSGAPRFGYYETFTFSNGHKGLIQKSYDRSKVSETFSLSFYNDQGLAYVVNQEGDILLRSVGMIGDHFYENIFDILTGTYGKQEDVDRFVQALSGQSQGSMTFTGYMGSFVYTYVPIKNVDGWYLVSIVPADAISTEAAKILRNSRMTLGFLALLLTICIVFILLIWRTRKDLEAKENAVSYQSRLFDAFVTYLSTNADDVYVIMDHKTEALEYVSPNITHVFGVNPNEITSIIDAADMAEDQEYYTRVRSMAPGETIPPRNTERVNPVTGEHKHFLENTYCTVIQGQVKRMVYISDRTNEWKIQNSLREALQMAQAANTAKSAFLSNISHDIRTPMNSIIGFLTLMQGEANNPEKVLEYTQRIDAASQHLLGLINDVLDMNKIESGSTTLNISEMNLAEVIDEINTIIRPQAKAKNQSFDISVSHLSCEHLMGDKLRINQILINLLSNAVKYTPEGGVIQMRVEELSQVIDNYSRIRFTISDNGLGMNKEYLDVIFDPFTREENKLTHEIQGTGLGMAITKSLVDLMGGTIHVESEPGKGSTFTVELELRIQEREDTEDLRFWADHKISRIIVADDEEDICHTIVKTMSPTGVSTDYSTDGKSLLRKMCIAREAGHPYDLILLDWKMPGLSGLETARLIRKNYPEEIPILLITAYDWSEIEQEAMEIGVDHFMPKPFFLSTFKDVICRISGNINKQEASSSSVVQDKHILVVDDIEANRIILVKILNTLGATCDIAANGQEAVTKFEASQPGEYDLILMDVQMPVMDGYAATKAIRSSSHPSARSLPIIAMTANAFVDDVRDAITSGMDAHIAKPVQVDKLKSTIQQVFDKRQEERI